MNFLARVSERLITLSTGRLTLVTLAMMLFFMAFILPGQSTSSGARTGGGPQPDTSLVYTPDDLYRMAEAFGPEGRRAYIQARWTFDLVFPLVYGFFLTASIGWLAARAFLPGNAWRLLNLAPVLGMLFDYLENITTSVVIGRYPAHTPFVDVLAPLFTAIKWIVVGGSFVVLMGVAVAALVARARRRSRG